MYQRLSICTLLSVVLVLLPVKIHAQSDKEEPIKSVVNGALDFSVQQSLRMARSLQNQPSLLPRTTDRFGTLQTCRSDWWASGFFFQAYFGICTNTRAMKS